MKSIILSALIISSFSSFSQYDPQCAGHEQGCPVEESSGNNQIQDPSERRVQPSTSSEIRDPSERRVPANVDNGSRDPMAPEIQEGSPSSGREENGYNPGSGR